MIIKNGLVFNAEGRFEEKEVYVEDEKISKTGEGEIIDATGLYVIPGLTDIHFHACVGYDFCDGTKEAISKMAEYELKNGITTICPASMTFSEEKLSEIYKTAREYDGKEGAELVGINMEGPFISMEKKAKPEKINTTPISKRHNSANIFKTAFLFFTSNFQFSTVSSPYSSLIRPNNA